MYRFYPWAIVGLVTAGQSFVRAWPRGRTSITQAISGGLVLLGIYQGFVHVSAYSEHVDYAEGYYELLTEENAAAADWITRHIPADERLAVYLDAGIVPYRTRMKTLDLGRLNDEFLARPDVLDTETAQYVFESDPGVFVITSTDWYKLVYNDRLEAVTTHPGFKRYRLAKKFRPAAPRIRSKYFQFVYVREDLLPDIDTVD